MRSTTSLAMPQPCTESWDAMSPTAQGRHCAACAKTVVDFTLKTDAEILAYLAGAVAGRTCGRFAAGQLGRPLQRAASAAPNGRWRAWLTAAVAVWGLREGGSAVVKAQAPTEWRARYWGGPVPAVPTPQAEMSAPTGPPANSGSTITVAQVNNMLPASPDSVAALSSALRGTIIDAKANETIPGVTVLVKGTTMGTSTDADGRFVLPVPEALLNRDITLVFSSFGFVTEERVVRSGSASQLITMQLNVQMLGGMEMYMSVLPPAPWHPRRFYYWGKYWLARPFRHRW